MEISLKDYYRGLSTPSPISAARGIYVGATGGFLGTLAMDILLIAALAAFGKPVFTCFIFVGSTAVDFFGIHGVGEVEIILLGVAAHYLIGPLAGGFFGLIMARVPGLQTLTRKDMLVLAIVFIETMSQPILATAPLLLEWPARLTLVWYGGSYIMHFILGCILGAVVNVGFRKSQGTQLSRRDPYLSIM